MSGELYFNEKEWRKLGLNTQQVRYLQFLLTRVGGSPAPDMNLDEVSSEASNISSEISGNAIMGYIHKLELRINELESLHGQ